MIRLLAIRHAPVTVERIFYGQTDVPTTLTGAEAAAHIESVVAAFAPGAIWSSDAVRCRVPAALLSKRPNPSDFDIDAEMADNVCRCGTYQRIRRAIHRAAEIAAG